MFIAEIILFTTESLFLVYLIRKQRSLAKKEKRIQFEMKSLGKNSYVNVTADEMQRVYNTDAKTGKPLPPDSDVDFCDLY